MLSNEITRRRRRRRRKRKILHAKKTQHKQISNNFLLSNMIKLSSLIEKAVLRNKPNNQIKLQRGLMSKLSYSCSQPCQHDGDIIYAAFIRNLTTVKTFKRRETSVKFHFILFTQSHFQSGETSIAIDMIKFIDPSSKESDKNVIRGPADRCTV